MALSHLGDLGKLSPIGACAFALRKLDLNPILISLHFDVVLADYCLDNRSAILKKTKPVEEKRNGGKTRELEIADC